MQCLMEDRLLDRICETWIDESITALPGTHTVRAQYDARHWLAEFSAGFGKMWRARTGEGRLAAIGAWRERW